LRAKPRFPNPNSKRERRQKLEEVKLDRTQPGFLASERLRKVLFGAHPVRAGLRQTEQQVASYKRDDLVSIYRDFYTPQNALLTLMVGDFDSASMLETIENVFGGWSGSKPAISPSPEPRQASRTAGSPGACTRCGTNANSRRLSCHYPASIRIG